MHVRLLGTGAADGWPNPWCSCESCADARARGESRRQTSVLLDGGVLLEEDPDAVSEKAYERGMPQLGSLGAGNHFLEVQRVDEIFDASTAAVFELARDQVVVMIHCGSRGLGHQICTDHVRAMESAMPRYGISVADRQLACAPVEPSRIAA